MPSTRRRAIDQLRRGKSIVVHDDQICALAIAAEFVDVDTVNRFLHLGGVLGAAVAADRVDELGIEPMVAGEMTRSAPTVSVDVANGGTGISARDRTETLRALCFAPSRQSLVSPGHIFPVRVVESDDEIPAIPDACVMLARAAALSPVVAYSAILDRDGRALAPGDLAELTIDTGAVISVRDVEPLGCAVA